MATTSIGDALFTKTQQKLLGLLFAQPDKRFYTNEIMRWAAMGRGTISRELERLLSAGLLTVVKVGNQNYYQANKHSPVFSELVDIVKKTFGISDQIKAALEPLGNRLEFAFIYGSIAKGTDTAESDIDLMLIGKPLNYTDVMALLLPLEESLQRAINPTLYGKLDFIKKFKMGNGFIQGVMNQPIIMIKGLIDDLRQSVQD